MATGRSVLFGGWLAGKAGQTVFVRRRDGTIGVRVRTTPDDPRTPAQQAQRSRMALAGAAWRRLTGDQVDAWRRYAQSLGPQPTPKGGAQPLCASTAFTRLALKYLEVNTGSEPPVAPPTAPFYGDGVSVTASAPAGSGQVAFAASAPNSPGVTTELLLQPLRSPARTPTPRGYRSAGFAAFSVGSLSVSLAAEPGAYAPAYRFVCVATGQASRLIPLGVVEVS